MKQVHHKTFNLTPILIGSSLLLIGMVGVTSLWALTRVVPSTVTKPESPSAVEVRPAKFSPQIYRLEVADNRILLVPKNIYTSATSPEVALTHALNKLLSQSPDFDPTTTIPQKTRLLDLHTNQDGIYVDMSREFTQGGGSSSMIYRVAQVLYTVTSIDPQKPVFISIQGQPLDEDYPLGGEGLLLEYPLTRQQFNQEFLAE
jgi:spore germination protein GerM